MTSSRTTPTTRMAPTTSHTQTHPLSYRHLWRAGWLAVVVAAVANAIVFAMEKSLFGLPMLVALIPGTAPAPLPWLLVIGTSVVAAIGATLLLALLVRAQRTPAQRPLRWFQIIAVIVLILSFWGPLTTEADAATKVALAVMHVVAAVAIVGVLSTQARSREL